MSTYEEQAIYPSAELYLLGRFMHNYGISPQRWLLGTGITNDEANNPDTRLSIHQFDVIQRNISRLLSDMPDAGIRLGASLNLSRWGVLAGALLSSQTLGDALATANQLKILVRSRFELTTEICGSECRIEVTPVSRSLPVSLRFSLEVLIAGLQTQITQLIGEPFYFSSIATTVKNEGVGMNWKAHFQCPIEFNAEKTVIVLPTALLRRPLPLANPVTHAQLLKVSETEAQRLRQIQQGDRVWELREWLSKQSGRAGMSEAAQALKVSERTLRRQLQVSGHSYSQLAEEHCLQIALERLEFSNDSVTQVSVLCGYRDLASFRKAFSRYTGMSPREFRQKNTASQ
jgi:AraC-like DNA-binding protein